MTTKAVMKTMAGYVVCALIAAMISFGVMWCVAAHAGDKEEAQARFMALIQEERALQAEFSLYQIKMAEVQKRFPELQREKETLQKKLMEMDEAEKKAKEKEAPKTPPKK